MSRMQQCPVCFGELEARRVEPCFVCGGWLNVEPSKPEHHFTIREDGTPITLCNICWLEEVLSEQGDLKERLKIKGHRDLVDLADRISPEWDKFCPACNRRLALLEVMARRLSDEDLETWRK